MNPAHRAALLPKTSRAKDGGLAQSTGQCWHGGASVSPGSAAQGQVPAGSSDRGATPARARETGQQRPQAHLLLLSLLSVPLTFKTSSSRARRKG